MHCDCKSVQAGLLLGEYTGINHGEKQSAISVRYKKMDSIKYLWLYKSEEEPFKALINV